MKKIHFLKLNCCKEDNKCETCPPEWTLRYIIELDDEKAGLDRYEVYFPLMGFDDTMRKNIKYFNPFVMRDGIWYLKESDAVKIYRKTEQGEKIGANVYALKQMCAEMEEKAAKESPKEE